MGAAKRLTAAMLTVAMAGGCASSGGGSEEDWQAFICAIYVLPCLLQTEPEPESQSQGELSQQTVTTQGVALTSWSDLKATDTEKAGAASFAIAMGYQKGASGQIVPDWIVFTDPDSWGIVGLSAEGIPVPHLVGGYGLPTQIQHAVHDLPPSGNLAAVDQPEIVVFEGPTVAAAGASPFVSSSSSPRHVVMLANAPALGWDYQSFGAWNGIGDFADGVVTTSFGAATPASAVPATGVATFAGKLGGLYVSPAGEGSLAAANLSVTADFSARSLSLRSDATSMTRDLATGVAAPHLNLSGTLTYVPGSSVFAGTLANAGGTLSGSSSGRFYGPAAQELGGTFALRSGTTAESFVGGYGAKR